LKPDEASQTNRPTLCYARMSIQDQKEDLVRQVRVLAAFCAANGWTYEVMQDLGSGLITTKKRLEQLIRRICSGSVGRLVVTNKDRLQCFGSELIFGLCEIFQTEVVIINQGEQPLGFEEELAQDVLEIITVFSARLYGNTAYIERLNATFRQRLACLFRRTRHLARQSTTLQDSMYVLGCIYNFCDFHQSLRLRLSVGRHGFHWVQRTPALAAGLTDHRWTLQELFLDKTPPRP
jgi:predicted site-specific integrase-resolvase